jgi:hypothetical protein
MKKMFVFLMLILFSDPAYSVEIPKHAHAKVFEAGWECDEGFFWDGNRCAVVVVPEHGRLNLLGHGWECESGYVRSKGACVSIQVPDHAEIDPFGKGWNCLPGFYKEGETCVQMQLPVHARLDDTGKDWECEHGFKKQDVHCIEMTFDEKVEAKRLLEESLAQNEDRGPEGTACHAGYNKCTSACCQPVYDHSTGRQVKNSDFIDLCSRACSQARFQCEGEDPKRQCVVFNDVCPDLCPTTVHDLDFGQYLASTNSRDVCVKACRYGMARCEYHAREVLPKASKL